MTWRNADLARPDRDLSKRIELFLTDLTGAKKPPVIGSQILALIVLLHREGRRFPQRAKVAKLLGCSVSGIDGTLYQAQRRGLIMLEAATLANPARQAGGVHERYFVPTARLLDGIAPR